MEQKVKPTATLLSDAIGAMLRLMRGEIAYARAELEEKLRSIVTGALLILLSVAIAGAALASLRQLGFGEDAAEAAVTRVEWPARMQRLRTGPLTGIAPEAELWLDGGHNPDAGNALSAHLATLPRRPTHLICGMLNTKDVAGYLRPMAKVADGLIAVSIPDQAATLPADVTADTARRAGLPAQTADTVENALRSIVEKTPAARVLICGSLYLAGQVLRDNG